MRKHTVRSTFAVAVLGALTSVCGTAAAAQPKIGYVGLEAIPS
jgi:hypothetical protein